jgi:uncharacterized SAM-dependent methyltransferase
MFGAHVFVDRSQFPENVRRDLLVSLATRVINHKFHYESYKQAAKWLALHDAYSPARTDASCGRIYDQAFSAALSEIHGTHIRVVGLGCGGGMKEARLLELLHHRKRKLAYTAIDVSLPLVLTARKLALPFVTEKNCEAGVCDLGADNDLAKLFSDDRTRSPRLFTLFGVIPNFEPARLLCQVARLLSANDLFLFSANLAAGQDYAAGVRAVLPQYDNVLTCDWLMTLLLDLGFEHGDGKMTFRIETDKRRFHRITADFEICRSRDIRVFGRNISYRAGERMQIFFSYRHTSQTIQNLLAEHAIALVDCWLNDSGEEGVFLCRKITRHSRTSRQRRAHSRSGARPD